MRLLGSIIILSILCSFVWSSNILGIIPSPFYSHQSTWRPLWRELAKRGHNLTLITTNLMEQNENITQIDFGGTYTVLEKHNVGYMVKKNGTFWDRFKKFLNAADDLLTYQMTHPDLEPLKDPNKYHCDLIIAEVVFPMYYALGTKLGCPVIAVSSMDALPAVHGYHGNAIHPAIYAYADLGYGEKLTFKERLKNVAVTGATYLALYRLFQVFDSYVEEYIGRGLPKMPELHSSLSLLIVNANPIFFPIRTSTPTTINIGGGIHLEKPKPLPQDLQDYLDRSEHGCIYFSFGSTVNSNSLGQEIIEIFRATFEEIAPIRVLWKFENETLPNKPKNVEIRKWLPQQDILRHPNVKAFITQGGLQSMEEAIDSAIPMLGMPFYGDQINNVKKMVHKQFGVALDIKTMTKESLKGSILELINNPIYKKNVEKLSAISKDQPMRGLEKAVWWTEYVLRHGGTEHLRSPSQDIPLYQYLFLDLIAFIAVILFCISVIFYYFIKMIIKLFRCIFSRKIKEKVN